MTIHQIKNQSAAIRMSRFGLTFGALLVASALGSAANAKECVKTKVTAASEPSISRAVGAYPQSLLAWRKAAAESADAGYNNWSSAEDRKIDCNQTTVVNGRKLWVCKRTARPCKGFGPEVAAGSGGSGSSSGSGGSSSSGSSGSGSGSCGLTFPSGRKSIRPGDKGSDVIKIQQALISKGANLAKGADGNFGSGTDSAVREFQRKAGISPADGFVGRTTCSKMGL
jgi:Putative peptidoglycan binding domain